MTFPPAASHAMPDVFPLDPDDLDGDALEAFIRPPLAPTPAQREGHSDVDVALAVTRALAYFDPGYLDPAEPSDPISRCFFCEVDLTHASARAGYHSEGCIWVLARRTVRLPKDGRGRRALGGNGE